MRAPEARRRPEANRTADVVRHGGRVDDVTVTRQRDKSRPPTVVPRVVSIYTTRGGHRLLLIVRCACGWHHQHTAAPTFAEGIRKAGCGRRYLVRVAGIRGEAA